jgi:hypothetical protein
MVGMGHRRVERHPGQQHCYRLIPNLRTTLVHVAPLSPGARAVQGKSLFALVAQALKLRSYLILRGELRCVSCSALQRSLSRG